VTVATTTSPSRRSCTRAPPGAIRAAVAMAEGYSWAAKRPGVCSVTHGPGLTQVATSLVVAARNGSKLVLVAAETPAGYAGAQDYDQEAFIAACEAPYRRMAAGDDPGAIFDEVMALAERRSGPVVLAVPADLLTAPAASAGLGLRPAAPVAASDPGVSSPGPEEDEAAALLLTDALAQSARPVIVAGRGAMGGASARLLMSIAGHYGADGARLQKSAVASAERITERGRHEAPLSRQS